MDPRRTALAGWGVALLMGGVILGSGFQTPTNKIGVVDLARLVDESEFGKANRDLRSQMSASRQSLLEFIDNNRVLTTEQAQKLRELGVKLAPTAGEKAEIETVKAQVIAQNKKWSELATKSALTPEERTLLQDYSRRSADMEEYAKRLYREFTNEMDTVVAKQKTDSVAKARAAIATVGKAEGYTVVLEVGVATYGANDVTEPSLVAMNAAK